MAWVFNSIEAKAPIGHKRQEHSRVPEAAFHRIPVQRRLKLDRSSGFSAQFAARNKRYHSQPMFVGLWPLKSRIKSLAGDVGERTVGSGGTRSWFDWWCYLWSGMHRSKLSAAVIRRSYHNQITLAATAPSLPVSRVLLTRRAAKTERPAVSVLFDGDGLSGKRSPITSSLFSVSCIHLRRGLKGSRNMFVQEVKWLVGDFHMDKNRWCYETRFNWNVEVMF